MKMETAVAQKQDLVRIDKNITMFVDDLVRTYKDNATMILDVLIFSAYKQQKAFWSMEVFDPVEFAEARGYPKNYLTETKGIKSEQSNHEKIDKLTEVELFTNRLENALYLMTSKNLVFRKTVKDFSKGETVSEVKAYQLIKTLRKHQKKGRRGFVYSFELNETFMNHINKFSIDIDHKLTIGLRKQRLFLLYMYVRTLGEVVLKKKQIATPSFDTMVEVAEITSKRPRDARNILEKKLDRLVALTDMEFKHERYKKSGKHEYGLKLDFKRIGARDNDPGHIDKRIKNQVAVELKKYFKEMYCPVGTFDKVEYKKWFWDRSKDIDKKMDVYFKTHHYFKKTSSKFESEKIARSEFEALFTQKANRQ